MLAATIKPDRYALSFTTGGLLVRECTLLAPVYIEQRDWGKARSVAIEGNLLQVRTRSTGVRLVRETIKRLSALADDEVKILPELTAPERAYLMWAAACRRYTLLGEFAEEVLRERFLLLAPDVKPEHFEAFLRGKELWHEELADLKATTRTKLRTTTFLMMREAGLVTDAGTIVPAIIPDRLRVRFTDRIPSDIRLFPTREAA